MELLLEYKHTPVLVSPSYEKINELVVHKDLSLMSNIDTLTVYVNPKISDLMLDQIVKLNPRRVIFNPGSENVKLAAKLKENGIEVEDACTLVLLRTNQF